MPSPTDSKEQADTVLSVLTCQMRVVYSVENAASECAIIQSKMQMLLVV